MGFWIYMTFMAVLIPMIMIIFGCYFSKKAPNSINYVFGYRTARSMKNERTWTFAHNFIGKLWTRAGIANLAVSVLIMLLNVGKDTDTVGYSGALCMILPLVSIFITIIITEIALKKNFDEHGNKRS